MASLQNDWLALMAAEMTEAVAFIINIVMHNWFARFTLKGDDLLHCVAYQTKASLHLAF